MEALDDNAYPDGYRTWRSSVKLSFVARKVGGKLVPVDLHGDEELARIKEGTEVYIEAVNFVPGTLQQLRTIWWLCGFLLQNDPHSESRRFRDKEDVLLYLMIMCRFVDTRISAATGSTLVTRKSLRDLSREELSALIECTKQVLQDEIGVERPQLIAAIMEAIGASN